MTRFGADRLQQFSLPPAPPSRDLLKTNCRGGYAFSAIHDSPLLRPKLRKFSPTDLSSSEEKA